MKKIIINRKVTLKHEGDYIKLEPKKEFQEFDDVLADKIVEFKRGEYYVEKEESKEIEAEELKVGEIKAPEIIETTSNAEAPDLKDAVTLTPGSESITIENKKETSYPITKFRSQNKEKDLKQVVEEKQKSSFFTNN